MRLQHFLPVLAILAMLVVGCESQQTSSLDEPMSAPPPQQKDDGPLEALAFWTWGDDEPDPVTKDKVLGDLTPELATTTRTSDEADFMMSRTVDYNGRQAWHDLMMVWLLDRPTRLSTTPMP